MDWPSISVIAGVLLTITTIVLNSLGILGKIASALRAALRALGHLLHRAPALPDGVPARTVAIVQQPRINALWWSEGSISGRPMLQVVGDFNITNLWSKDIKLAGALLRYKRWLVLTRTIRGDSSVKDLKSVYSGTYHIPPNQMTWLRVSFYFIPRDGMPTSLGVFNASVAVIDQFGNHHWVENLSFKHPGAMLEP